jgi:hypothetical protein
MITGNRSLIALRQKYFRGGDGLAHVALSMFRDMHEKSRHRGWQIFSTDRASFLQGRSVCAKVSNALAAQLEGSSKFFKKRAGRNFRAAFTLQCRELLLIQHTPLGISEQAIHAAGDMAELKGNRGQAIRRGVEFRVAQIGAPSCDVFAGLFERVNRRARYGRNV